MIQYNYQDGGSTWFVHESDSARALKAVKAKLHAEYGWSEGKGDFWVEEQETARGLVFGD